MALKLKKRDLGKYDLELVIDVSPSMAGTDTPSGLTRLEDSKKLATVLVQEMSKLDDDGMTIVTGDEGIVETFENTTEDTAASVLRKAQPTGSGTDQSVWLQTRIDAYFERRFGKPGTPDTTSGWGIFKKTVKGEPAIPANPNCKPLIIVVITDGEPNGGKAGQQKVVNVIVNATKRLTKEGLTRDALGISFIQAGRDRDAKRFLDYLNNELKPAGATMDIVNCLTMDEAVGKTTEQILEAALDD